MTLPPGARTQSDGSITFPCRGKAPDCNVPGYVPDPFDPFRWIMVYCPCKHRLLMHKFICSTGKERTADFCGLLKIPISPRYCNVDCSEIDR